MRFIDISLPVDASLPVWPGDPPIEIGRFLDMNTGDAVKEVFAARGFRKYFVDRNAGLSDPR